MGVIKDKSIDTLKDFEIGKDIIRNADYKDLKTFVADFLNTSDKKHGNLADGIR